MNPQAAYELLISAANYCMVFSFDDAGPWEAAVKLDRLALSLCDGHIRIDMEQTQGNLNKWQRIRDLAGHKPLKAHKEVAA
jgi:hypothetical protein